MPYYYNIVHTNTTITPQPMRCDRELQSDIIPKGKLSDYQMCVIRAVVSNTITPLMDLDLPNFQPLEIAMRYQGYVVRVVLQYSQSVTGHASNDGLIDQFEQFIIMLNTTALTCWTFLNDLITLPSTQFSTGFPFSYDPVNQLMSYSVNTDYLDTSNDPILLAVNYKLSLLLQGFQMKPVTLEGEQFFQMYAADTGDNFTAPNGLFKMTQTCLAFSSICSVNQIMIQTTLPVQTEMYSDNTQLPVVLDFIPAFTMKTFRNTMIYEPIVPYRKYDIQGNVQYVSFNVLWSDWSMGISDNSPDSTGKINQMILAPGQSFNLKIMFTPKV